MPWVIILWKIWPGKPEKEVQELFITEDAQDLIRNLMGEEQLCNRNHNILRLNIPADTETSHAVAVNIK